MRHVYPALASSHIRILILQPSFETDAPLRFSFHSASIDELRGKYEAISYTWGKPELVFPLHHEDGSCVCVTENLDSALRRLRHRLDAKWLWADSVCMDQMSFAEKAHQIPMMDQIYRGAKRVLAWLGPGGGDVEIGMQMLEGLSQATRRSGVPAVSATHILTFFNLPWFRRFWTVQECVLNVDVTLLCGRSEITLAKLLAGLRIYKEDPASRKEAWLSPGVRAIEKTADLWKKFSLTEANLAKAQIADDFDIFTLVDQFLEHGCSDDRDRIFALYSLASNIEPVPHEDTAIISTEALRRNIVYMDVDYSLSVRESYTTFAVACMKADMTMRMLEAATARPHDRDPEEWPSWVPDWRLKPTNRGIYDALSTISSSRIVFTGESFGNIVGLQIDAVCDQGGQ